ncbi:hypothetical protein NQZ68_039295 [Dissostichus eleginoides]|nr:hypothetical protein NQZ68_039295 [Dissostichus eleginoides]
MREYIDMVRLKTVDEMIPPAPEELKPLLQAVNILVISTECEHGFSQMNILTTTISSLEKSLHNNLWHPHIAGKAFILWNVLGQHFVIKEQQICELGLSEPCPGEGEGPSRGTIKGPVHGTPVTTKWRCRSLCST